MRSISSRADSDSSLRRSSSASSSRRYSAKPPSSAIALLVLGRLAHDCAHESAAAGLEALHGDVHRELASVSGESGHAVGLAHDWALPALLVASETLDVARPETLRDD